MIVYGGSGDSKLKQTQFSIIYRKQATVQILNMRMLNSVVVWLNKNILIIGIVYAKETFTLKCCGYN